MNKKNVPFGANFIAVNPAPCPPPSQAEVERQVNDPEVVRVFCSGAALTFTAGGDNEFDGD